MEQHTVGGRHPLWQQRSVHLLARGILIGLLVVPATLALPGTVKVALAAPLEDCDADGFDDATGVAVPWPGFDETHGDTSAGPGTADWWIAQNTKPATDDSNGSPGGGTDATGGSGAGGGSGGSGSGGDAGTAPDAGAAVGAQAPGVAAPGANAAASDVTIAGASASAASSASAESSGAALARGTSARVRSAAGDPGLWDALTVGFTGHNKELFAGLGLLAALALAGALALGISALRGIRSPLAMDEGELLRTEEQALA